MSIASCVYINRTSLVRQHVFKFSIFYKNCWSDPLLLSTMSFSTPTHCATFSVVHLWKLKLLHILAWAFSSLHICKFSMLTHNTDQADVAVMLWTCIQEFLGLNFSWNTSCPEVLHRFPRFFKPSARIVPQLGHDCFLSNSSQFAIQQSSHHSMLCNLDTDIVIK
jgi:hypothetical protein